MEKNKGFTLIELLAVIIILAIIALIATPLIMNIIEESKVSSLKAEGEFLVDGALLHIQSKELKEEDILYEQNIYDSIKLNKEKIGHNSSNPSLYINSSKQVRFAIYDSGYCITKEYDQEEITVTKTNEEDCKYKIPNYELVSKSIVADTVRNISSVNKLKFEYVETMPDSFDHDLSKEQNGSIVGVIEGDTYYVRVNGQILVPKFTSGMFSYLHHINTIEFGTLPSGEAVFNTSEVTDMSYMFHQLSNVTTLDLSTFDTSNVTNMSYMFLSELNNHHSKLEQINLSSFDTSKVISMRSMFESLDSLKSIDLSSFNTEKVKYMNSLFAYSESIETINLSSFDTSEVTNMSQMFLKNKSLKEIDVSSFNTIKVTNMGSMFQDTISLTTLDLSNFDISSNTEVGAIFLSSVNLEKVYVKTQEAKDILNASYGLPSSLNIEIK